MAMADLWEAPVEGASSREVAEALSAHMLGASALLREREGLPADARSALEALVSTGGRMPLAAFERRFGGIRPMGPGKLERERPWLAPSSAAEALWYRGFIFRAFDNKGTPREMAFVPSDVLEQLKPQPAGAGDGLLAVGPPGTRTPMPGAEAAFPLHSQDRRATGADLDQDGRPSVLLDDVVTLLCHIQNGDVKLLVGGEWDKPARQALGPMLKHSDGQRLEFLLHVIERLGFIRVADGKLRLLSQPVTNWLQSGPLSQRAALYQVWLADESWNDLAHVPGISLTMTHTWSYDVRRARQAIVSAWQAQLPQTHAGGQSIDFGLGMLTDAPTAPQIDACLATIKSSDPDFARPDGRYDTWHVRDEATGEFLHGFDNWDRIEGALVRYVLGQPLRWLMASDAALSGLDATVGVRTGETKGPENTLNAVLSPRPRQPVTVSPAGQITVSAARRFERFQLARVADWTGTQDEDYTYVLTTRSLARAREQGIRAGRVLEFLEQTSAHPVPEGVRIAIVRWNERGVEARLEAMVILKTQDTATMDALLRVQTVRRAVVDRFAPNCISIRACDADGVRAAIVESGLIVDGA